jgi:hypothetical protein
MRAGTRMFDDDPPGSRLLASHLPALLERGLYHPDGQLEGEAYEWGSFVQSRMYHEGVTCSDCHDPHTLGAPRRGQRAVHALPRRRAYDVVAHHHHAAARAAAQCVTCHMPEKTFMVIDRRRDHGLRVPRPDLAMRSIRPTSARPATRTGRRAGTAARVREWSGTRRRLSGFRRPLAARERRPAAPSRLAARRSARDRARDARRRARRRSTVRALETIRARSPTGSAAPSRRRARGVARRRRRDGTLLAPALGDSLRVLRALAGGALAGMPAERVPPERRADSRAREGRLRRGRDRELRPGVRAREPRELPVRRRRCRAAPRRAPPGDRDRSDAGAAYANLADLLRATDRDAEAEAVLRAGLARLPRRALHHALGLWLVRHGRHDDALASSRRRTTLAPAESRFAYVVRRGARAMPGEVASARASCRGGSRGGRATRTLTRARAQLTLALDGSDLAT